MEEKEQINVEVKQKSAFKEAFEKKLGETAAGCFTTIIIFFIIIVLMAISMTSN